MLKEETAGPLWDFRHFWREHVLLNQSVAHVVILSAPAPKVDSIAVHLFKLLTGEDGDAAKEVLSCTNFEIAKCKRQKKSVCCQASCWEALSVEAAHDNDVAVS